MNTMKWASWMLCSALAAAGCASTDAQDDQGRGVNQEGVYRYVLDVDGEGVPLFGGAHEVVVPSERGKEEAIDDPNKPSRLYPVLGQAAYKKYDATRTEGHTDWEVFASTWWAQKDNGIAKRWTGGDQDLGNHSVIATTGSPAEKIDKLLGAAPVEVSAVEHWNMPELRKPAAERGPKHSHPAVTVAGPATAWELRNHGLYQTYAHPDSWWGHCNGWASYATAEAGSYPKRDIKVKLVNGAVTECVGDLASDPDCITFRMGDIEALMSELYFSDKATFTGRRCNSSPDDMSRDEYGRPTEAACRDLNPGSFHIGVVGLLNRGATPLFETDGLTVNHPAFVIDHNYDWEVWNFPLTDYEILEQEEITEQRAQELVGATGSDYTFNSAAVKFVRIKMNYSMVSDGVSDSKMLLRADQRNVSKHVTELNYVLELNASDEIIGGEWTKDPSTTWGDDSKKLHPDFYWAAVNPVGYGESADDTGGSDDNPHIAYPLVKSLLTCANDASTCAPAGGGGGGGGGGTTGPSCEGSCGGQSADGCWCDSSCSQYGDCCGDYTEVCTAGGGGGGEPPAPAATCVGHCGGEGTGGCYCDDQCSTYGDCCEDYASACQ